MKYYYKKNAKIAFLNEIRDFKVFIKFANDIYIYLSSSYIYHYYYLSEYYLFNLFN